MTDGSRTNSYGYSTSYNSQGDLTSFTDTEGKTSTYVYDTNHQITATLDALSRLVVSNNYDTQGHITTQYTQGDTNKMWLLYWSGWQTTEFDPAGGETDYYYDDQGRLTAVVDPLNFETDSYYDGQNHIVETVSPLNETNGYVYDGNNNLLQQIDALGFTNQYIYDNQSDLIRSVDPRGNASTFGYNSQFSLTGSTNGAGDWVNNTYNTDGTLHTRTDSGGQTTYGYDTFGLLNSVTYPGSLGSESFANSFLGDATNHTDARGLAMSFQFNSRRQLTNSIAPTNRVTRIAYDSVGNATTGTDPRGNTATNIWSVTRHLLATAMPATPQGAPVVTNIYDSRDWLIEKLDPYQQATRYTNDADGRLISATDPLQRITKFKYDADGHKLRTVNAANETNSQTWDKRGSLIKLTDGAGHFSVRVYDAAGNQVYLTNRNSQVWQFQFDGVNRLTNTISPLGRSYSLIFNHQGKPTLMTDPASQSTTNTYDGLARLVTRGDKVGITTNAYDPDSNLTNCVENGKTNAWTYDAYNRVSSYRDGYGNLIQYRYDANGNMTNLIYPGNRTVTYLYDSLNRLTNVTDWAGRKSSVIYDMDGRMTGITRPNGSYRTISYDTAGQATNILEQVANSLPIALFSLNWTNTGNMGWEFAAPLPHVATVPTRTMTYDADNRLATLNGTGVTNDLDGNLTYGPLTNGTFTAYTYDTRNRLLNAGGVTNIYDVVNNRIGQIIGTNTTTFVVNPNAKLPQVLMRIKGSVTNYYIYGPGLLYQVTETATSTNMLTYHYDYRGSTVALSDGNGNVTDRIEYSAYGLMTYRAGTNDCPFLFNGLYGVQTDPNGLLYMRARYYNPYICRFINPDPSGFAGGLNFYAFANGNPVSLIDPFGLGAWTSAFGGLRVLGGGTEALVGFTFAAVTSETIVGAVAGGAVGLHGLDSFQAGWQQMISGQPVDSLTSQGLQAAGMSQTAANITDAGVSIIGTAGTSLLGAPSAAGPLVHITDSAGGAGINSSGTLIGDSGLYAGPLDNASASGWGVTVRTGLNPGDYEAAVPIPSAAEGAFSSVTPIGPITGWQSYFGQAYTQAGTLDLSSGIFTQTGLNWGQATFNAIDATTVNGGAFAGTFMTSGSGTSGSSSGGNKSAGK